MGRFFITNNNSAYKKARQLNKKAGLSKNINFETERFRGVIYDKRVKNVNNYRVTSNGLLGVVGTLLKNGKFGVKAIRKKVRSEELIKNRIKYIGHYAIIKVTKEEIIIVTDRLNTYEVYYYDGDNTLFVSSSLYLIAAATPNLEESNIGILEKSAFVQNLTNKTAVKGVNRLEKGELMRITNHGFKLDNISSQEKSRASDKPVTARTYAKKLNNITNQLSSGGRTVGLHFTGGLDSRTLLASFLSVDKEPLLLYGIGNSQITNTKSKDLKIFNKIADEYELKKYTMNWRGDYLSHDENTWVEKVEKFGYKYRFYGCTPSVFSEYEGGIHPYPDVLMMGIGKAFTNHKPWEKYQKDKYYNLERVVEDLLSIPPESISNYNMLKNRIVDYLVNRMDIDGYKVKGNKIIEIEFIVGSAAPSFAVNALNEFTYTLCPLATYEMTLPMFNVPNLLRKNNTFQLNTINKLEPSLLEQPLYSGLSSKNIKRRKSGFESVNVDGTSDSLLLKDLLKKSTSLFPSLIKESIIKGWRKATSWTTHKSNDQKIKNHFIKSIDDYGLDGNINTERLSPRSVNRLFLDHFCTMYALDQ